MTLEGAYVWLEKLKQQLKEDVAIESYIIAIEKAQEVIREKVTGIAEG